MHKEVFYDCDGYLVHPNLKPNDIVVAKGGINSHARSKKSTAVYKQNVHKEDFLRL